MDPSLAASAPAWISAISTAVLGILGLVFAGWQWWASGFHPKCEAEAEWPSAAAIRLRIRNTGRAPGVISHIAVIDSRALAVDWAQGPRFALPPTRLPGLDRMELIIQAPADKQFSLDHRIRVEWGEAKTIKLKPVSVGLFGLESVLPPP
jgi:hypothetical protein